MINWILSLFETNRVKGKSNIDFIMFNTAKRYIQGHIMTIIHKLYSKLQEARVLKSKYIALEGSEIECHHVKDKFGIVSILSRPIISEDMYTMYKGKLRLETFCILAFTLLEASFFFMIAEPLMGPLATVFGENEAMLNIFNVVVSIVLAFLSALLLDMSVAYITSFIKAYTYYKEDKITKKVYRQEIFSLVRAVITLLSFFASMYFMNHTRSFALDSPASANIGDEEVKTIINPYLANTLIAVSVCIAIVIAFLKYELKEVKAQLTQAKLNKSIRKSMMKLNEEVDRLYTKFENDVHENIMATKQMLADLRETMVSEIDSRDEALYVQFQNEYSSSGYKMNEELYRKYERLICVNDDLVDFAFKRDVYTSESLIEFLNIKKLINEKEQFYASILESPKQGAIKPMIEDEITTSNDSNTEYNDIHKVA